MRWKPKELNKVEGRDHMKVGKQMTDIVRKPRDVGELTKVSMFLTTVVLCVALIIMSVGIRNHYVRELEVNARNLALGYSHSLRKTVEASEIVQGLVQEKLLYATGIIATMEELSAIAPVLEGSWSEKRYSALRFGALEVTEKYQEESAVLKDVLIAVNHVKESSVVPYIFFDQVMEEKLRKETLIEGALKEALEHTDHEVLSLHYQPLIHGKTEEVVGLEALARMDSPQYGPIPPLVFIEIAEKNGLMMQLGEVLLRKAAAFGKRLELLGTPLRISVNISGMQLIQDDFMEVVKRVLKETGIPPKLLEFEITESVFLGNYEVINSKLMELKALGIVLSIDDFGTGYSSFARLKELHVDGVKIDRYFVSRISTLPEDQLISSDIIRMVHKYGLFVVAEGVENVVEKEYLQKEHCDVLQGYYFSKPLKEQDIVLFLNNNKPSREGFDEEEV